MTARTITNQMREDILNMLHNNPDKLIYNMDICLALYSARSSSAWQDIHTVCEFNYVYCSDVVNGTKIFSDSIMNIDAVSKEVTAFCDVQHRKIDSFQTERTDAYITVIVTFSDYVFNTDKKSLLHLEILAQLYNFNPRATYSKHVY